MQSKVRKRLLSCLVVIITTSLFTSVVQAEELLCSKLRATGNPEYPPYLWQDPQNPKKLIGANTEILKQLAKRLGIEIDVEFTGPWSRAQEEVRAGRYDLIAGAFYTRPRLEYMDYMYPPFLTTKSVVWRKMNSDMDFIRREDLIGKQGVTVVNNSFGNEFDLFAKAELTITTVPSLKQAFKILSLERAEYLLYEHHPAMSYAEAWGFGQQVERIGPPISSEGLYLTISHGSSCNNGALRGRLAQVLVDMTLDGTVENALQAGRALWKSQLLEVLGSE